LHESAEDLLEHRLSFTEDKVRGKAEHLYSTPLEESSPALLADFRFWIEVLSCQGAPHPSLSPLTRGEGEQSQRFVPYHFVERRSRDLIEYIPCPIR